MISIQEALDLIKSHAPVPIAETLPLLDAHNRILAEDIVAPKDSPSYPNSAMDGFAVIWSDVQAVSGSKPKSLKIGGESQAGIPFNGSASKGQAIRISTGAMIPEGCDTVIPIEVCQVEADYVNILEVRTQGQHVRNQGEDFPTGSTLLAKHSLLRSAQIALLASVGISTVSVFRRPKVALIITGSELVPYDMPAGKHQLHDSNRPMLATAVREAGGSTVYQNQVFDDLSTTVAALEQAEQASDIILFSGGVSVGPHDHVKAASIQRGFHEVFWKVEQKPGKPLYFAVKGNKVLLGLPGNPVSAFMCFKHYCQPLIRSSRGGSFDHVKRISQIGESMNYPGNRPQMIRVQITTDPLELPKIFPLKKQGSHMLSSISDAQGYILVEPGTVLNKGDHILVHLFNFGGI